VFGENAHERRRPQGNGARRGKEAMRASACESGGGSGDE